MADKKQFELDQKLVEEFNRVLSRLAQESNINWGICEIKCEGLFGCDKLSKEAQDKLKQEEREKSADIWATRDKLVNTYKSALETGNTTELINMLEETKNSPYCRNLDDEKIGIVALIGDTTTGEEFAAQWNGNNSDIGMYENVQVFYDGKICQAQVIGLYLEKDELSNISNSQAFPADMSEVDINKAIAATKEPKTLQGLLAGAREQKAKANQGRDKAASKDRDERQ